MNNHHLLVRLNVDLPQGSILEPLLFLIYNNNFVNTKDRLSLVCLQMLLQWTPPGKSLKYTLTSMNNQLANISNWFASNKLTLNEFKTQVTIFFWRKIPNLNWKDHPSFVAEKLFKSCDIDYKIRNCPTTSAKGSSTTASFIPL
jgi:hypothetical protein